MKVAETVNGERIEADAAAPVTGVCPRCQQTVTLRKRQRMGNNEYTYFWRHQANSGPCANKKGPTIYTLTSTS